MTARLRVLCITEHSDRPEAETFIGLKDEGVDVHVMCSSKARQYPRLVAAGVPVIARRVPGQSALEHLGGVTVPLVDDPGAMAREIEARLREPDWSGLRRSGLRIARAWRHLADDQFVRGFRRILEGPTAPPQ